MRESHVPRTEAAGRPADPRAAQCLARRLRDARASLTYRWLERIAERVSVERDEVFPSEALLNHVPLLIEAIAGALEQGGEGGTAEQAVLSKAAELGETRYRQGFSPYQVLKEFEVLGGILLSYLTEIAPDAVPDATPRDTFLVAHRMHRALSAIQQATAAKHLSLGALRVHAREQRLRSLHTHVERHVKARLDRSLELAREAAADVAAPDPAVAKRWRDRARELAGSLEVLRAQIDSVLALSAVGESARQQQNVPLAAAVAEAVRQVREGADGRGITLEVLDPVPDVEVNAAAVELGLLSYLNAAIRYASAPRGEAWVRVHAAVVPTREGGDHELVVEVHDSGRAVPEDATSELLDRYLKPFGEPEERAASGLGLSFVRDIVEALGGRAWARQGERPADAVFAFALPCRRAEDARAPAGG